MSLGGYLLLVLIPLAAIAWLVWDYKRKTAARSLASAGKLEELLLAARQPAPSSSETSAHTPAAQPSRADTPQSARHYVRRARVLEPPQTLLYYLLRTGLPDHLVFARVSLASILDAAPEVSGFAREAMQKALDVTVEFVVTDKNTRPVAIVELSGSDRGSMLNNDHASVRARVAAAGVRYVALEPTKLPRKEEMRALVLGESTFDLAGSAPQRIAR